MANSELVTRHEFYQVRAAIDLTLDTVALPDDIIALPIFLGRARMNVKGQDVLWATRIGDDLSHLTNAVVYFTASNIVTSLVRNSEEHFGTRWAFKRVLIDPATLATSLAGVAQLELDFVLNPGSLDSERPTLFALANPCWQPFVPRDGWGV